MKYFTTQIYLEIIMFEIFKIMNFKVLMGLIQVISRHFDLD